jgi:hypothetical protein
MTENETIIAQTKKWIANVVIGCNFCPFAPQVFKQGTIHYEVEKSPQTKETLTSFLNQCVYLDDNQNIETALLILPGSYQNFDDYLQLISQAERLMKKKGYEGIYQVASFHPFYYFANSALDDPANFTNRSPYRMLHILREDGIEEALLNYSHPENIPENNIKFAREKGYDYMKNFRDDCLKI